MNEGRRANVNEIFKLVMSNLCSFQQAVAFYDKLRNR
jgi:hypothetical protein